MVSAAPSVTKLTGQPAVMKFYDTLIELVEEQPHGVLTGSRHGIVEAVINRSPELTHCNMKHLTRQFRLILDAPCRGACLIYTQIDGTDQFEVSVA